MIWFPGPVETPEEDGKIAQVMDLGFGDADARAALSSKVRTAVDPHLSELFFNVSVIFIHL